MPLPRPFAAGLFRLEDRLAPALAGLTDPLFDGDGFRTFDVLGRNDTAAAVAVQSDGRIVVAGTTTAADQLSSQALVLRFLPDGTPDPSFDGDGVMTFVFGSGGGPHNGLNAVSIDPVGRIVVGGFGAGPRTDRGFAAVARLTATGALDPAFAGGGIRLVGGSVGSKVSAVLARPNGSVLFAGDQNEAFSPNVAFTGRLTDRGEIDGSYSGGQVSNPMPFSDQLRPVGLGVQPDGKIIVASTKFVVNTSIGDDFAITRLTADGQPDDSGTFQGLASGSGSKNTVTVDFGAAAGDAASAVAVLGDGSIVVVGAATGPGSQGTDFGVLRLNPDGSRAARFGDNGRALLGIGTDGSSADIPTAVAVAPDGAIVVGGYTFSFGAVTSTLFAVARLNAATGAADAGFRGVLTQADKAGFAVLPFGGTTSQEANGVAVLPDGRILLAGTRQAGGGGNSNVGLVRVFGTSPPLVVDSTADDADGDLSAGKFSLREAVTLANADPAANTITFAPSLSGKTVVLAGTQLPDASGTLTVAGPGAAILAVDGGGLSRLFRVTAGNNLTINDLTLQNGRTQGNNGGPAVQVFGELTLNRVHVRNNVSSLNGGGVVALNGGKLTATASTFSGNTAAQHGGAVAVLDAGSRATLTNVTLSGNSAVRYGGGLYAENGTVSVVHSLVVNNQAGSAGAAVSGGGVSVWGAVDLRNSIVGGNRTGSTVDDISGDRPATGNNTLVADANTAGGLTVANNNVLGVDLSTVIVPTLADNGGPVPTHALVFGPNPALGAGAKADGTSTDARDFPRPPDPSFNPAVGPYEMQLLTIRTSDPTGGTATRPFRLTLSASAPGLPAGTTYTFFPQGPLPAGFSLSPGGVVTATSPQAGRTTLTVYAVASTGDFAFPTELPLTFTAPVPPPPPPGPPPPPLPTPGKPVLVGYRQFATGTDSGGGRINLLNPDLSVRAAIMPFEGASVGVRAAAADFNGDGVADLVAGTGPGQATLVRVIDGANQQELFRVAPFEASFLGGVYVAAGDVTGDGLADLVITPDEGGGPRVRIFRGGDFQSFADFFGIEDVNFRGGARAAVADFTGDGKADVVVAAGFGGGPRVAAYDATTLTAARPTRVFPDFFAFEQTLRNGTFVTAGDVTGDGVADLIAGGGPGGGPRVLVYDGRDLIGDRRSIRSDFFAGSLDSRGGVRVAVKDLDGDDRADLMTGSGTGAGSQVIGFPGATLVGAGDPPRRFELEAFPGFAGGVFVG